jgi:hypothetical protein
MPAVATHDEGGGEMARETTSTDDGRPAPGDRTVRPIPPGAFADAVRRRDLGALRDLFAEDAELHTPVVDEPVVGADNIEQIFVFLDQILDDIEITTELGGPDRYVFGFTARVGAEPLQVLDLLSLDEHGRITEFVVHTRPLAGTLALANAVDPHRQHFRPA